jgi:hypothetical protein
LNQCVRYRGSRGMWPILDGHREQFSRRADEWCARELRQGRGHDEKTSLQIAQQSKREIGFEMPFVKLVQNDDAVWAQPSATQQSLSQNAFGEIPQPSAGAPYLLEANLKADDLTDRFTHLFGDAPGGHARGETARFEHIHLLIPGLEQSGWDAGSFASPRLSL